MPWPPRPARRHPTGNRLGPTTERPNASRSVQHPDCGVGRHAASSRFSPTWVFGAWWQVNLSGTEAAGLVRAVSKTSPRLKVRTITRIQNIELVRHAPVTSCARVCSARSPNRIFKFMKVDKHSPCVSAVDTICNEQGVGSETFEGWGRL